MATGDRKQSNRKQSRASRRRRGSGNQEGGEGAQRVESQGPPPKREGSDVDPTPNGQKVSALLETTSQEVKQLLEAADDAAQKIREAAQTDAEVTGESKGAGEASTLIKRTNSEVRQVLESADDAAEKIRKEARAEARQYVDEARRRADAATEEHLARVSKLSEQVLGELTSVQGQLEALQASFKKTIDSMNVDIEVEEVDEGEVWDTAPQNGVPEPEEESGLRQRLGRRTPQRKGVQEPQGVSEGARLLALQQLMAGVDAEVIAERLEKEFGIENPRAILEWMGLQVRPSDSSKKR